jgi:hypothetical protein
MRLLEFKSNPVKDLESGLNKLTRFDYYTIDKLMKKISKRHDISGKKLHDLWVKKYKIIPDQWIKKKKNITP